ncbi:hypothetical protein HYU14_01430 [Candidatus Woesearchaeota archaeon]|nr:hypothetical protein [Candidatus Woesearchaeota archaeon]
MTPDENSGTGDLFDLRESSLYEKMGGLRNFLSLCQKLDIILKGVKIRVEDLRVLIAYHNELFPDFQIIIDNDLTSVGFVKSPPTSRPVSPLLISPLEEAILAAYDVEGDLESTLPPQPQISALPPEPTLKDYVALSRDLKEDGGIVERAANILQYFRENPKFTLQTKELKELVEATSHIVKKNSSRKPHALITASFALLKKLRASLFSPEIVYSLYTIFDSIPRFPQPLFNDPNEIWASHYRTLLDINKEAFQFFGCLGYDGKRYQSRASYYFGATVPKLLGNLKEDGEKVNLLEEGINFYHAITKSPTGKNPIQLADAHYFLALFYFEKVKITRDTKSLSDVKRNLAEAMGYNRATFNKAIKESTETRINVLSESYLSFEKQHQQGGKA